jgi:hypothetical protein
MQKLPLRFVARQSVFAKTGRVLMLKIRVIPADLFESIDEFGDCVNAIFQPRQQNPWERFGSGRGGIESVKKSRFLGPSGDSARRHPVFGCGIPRQGFC